ncbi:MAG: hypothetical protein AAF411_11785 [Myxococcota bacterium]
MPLPASAQDGGRSHEAFERGIQAQNDGLLTDARDAFREALAVNPSRAAAFNLAYVLKSLEQTTEAVALFERLLSGEFGELREGQATEVAELLAEARREFARVRLQVCGVRQPEVRIDGGAPLGVEPCEVHEVALDAGRHVFVARAGHAQPQQRALDVRAGQQTTLRIELSVERRPLRRNPWLWVAVGVLAAGSVAIGIGLSRRPDPVVDGVFGVTDTQRAYP